MKYTSTIFLSAVVSGLLLFISRSNPDPTLEGLTERLWILPLYFVVVPLVFGLISLVISKENRWKRAINSTFISFLVVILMLIPVVFLQLD